MIGRLTVSVGSIHPQVQLAISVKVLFHLGCGKRETRNLGNYSNKMLTMQFMGRDSYRMFRRRESDGEHATVVMPVAVSINNG